MNKDNMKEYIVCQRKMRLEQKRQVQKRLNRVGEREQETCMHADVISVL